MLIHLFLNISMYFHVFQIPLAMGVKDLGSQSETHLAGTPSLFYWRFRSIGPPMAALLTCAATTSLSQVQWSAHSLRESVAHCLILCKKARCPQIAGSLSAGLTSRLP